MASNYYFNMFGSQQPNSNLKTKPEFINVFEMPTNQCKFVSTAYTGIKSHFCYLLIHFCDVDPDSAQAQLPRFNLLKLFLFAEKFIIKFGDFLE